MLSVSEIRTLIKERPGISLRDLALHFRVSPGMMEMMVSKLVDRDDVETVVPTSCCCGDCGCSSEDHGKHYKLTLKAFREMEA